MKSQVFAIFTLALCSLCAFGQRLEVVAIEPDMELQAKIEEVVRGMKEASGSDFEREWELATQGLVSAANGNRQDVMLQTLLWASQPREGVSNDEIISTLYGVLGSMNFSNEEFLDMALP